MQNKNLDDFNKYIRDNQINEAYKEINKLLYLDPDNYLFLHCYAIVLFKQSNLLEAIKIFKKSIALNSKFLENYFYISLCLIQLKMRDEAIFYLKIYVSFKQDNCDVYNNLGLLYLESNQLEDARLCFNKCISINLDYVKAYNNLAAVFFKKDLIDQAIQIIKIGLKIDPTFIDLSLNLSRFFARKNYYLKAIRLLKKILESNPSDHNILASIGGYYIKIGKILEGFEFIDKSLKINEDILLLETKLFSYFYKEDLDLDNYYKDIYKFKKILSTNIKVSNKNNFFSFDKKIRVGFVSSDFREHAVGYQVYDVIKNLSENLEFKLYLYFNKLEEDEISKSFKTLNINWINIFNMSDEEVVNRLRNDKIQILLDLAGFTTGGRLNVFSYKPCPIQISWCGFLASVGMGESHYIFADKYTIPSEDESNYEEKIYRLDKTWTVLSKNYHVTPDSSLPAFKNKFISFGSFNNILKVNQKVIKIWSKILCKVYNSKLYLFSNNFNDKDFKTYFIQLFLEENVKINQLHFESNIKRYDLLNKYNSIDITLDTFPYSGGTTSLESSWMGVPVLTKKGKYFISKSTESINNNIGLNDWIADDEDDYINKAINFSSNSIFLQSIRNYLLDNREKFIIYDSKFLAKNMSDAFKDLIVRQNA